MIFELLPCQPWQLGVDCRPETYTVQMRENDDRGSRQQVLGAKSIDVAQMLRSRAKEAVHTLAVRGGDAAAGRRWPGLTGETGMVGATFARHPFAIPPTH